MTERELIQILHDKLLTLWDGVSMGVLPLLWVAEDYLNRWGDDEESS